MDINHLVALCVCLYLMFKLTDHTQQASCIQCQGKGRHKPDCPFNKDREKD